MAWSLLCILSLYQFVLSDQMNEEACFFKFHFKKLIFILKIKNEKATGLQESDVLESINNHIYPGSFWNFKSFFLKDLTLQ